MKFHRLTIHGPDASDLSTYAEPALPTVLDELDRLTPTATSASLWLAAGGIQITGPPAQVAAFLRGLSIPTGCGGTEEESTNE